MSNRYLIIIALILIVGTVSDGVLYNRPVPSPAIYPLPDPKHIEIAYQDKLLLRLEKIAADSWVITAPFHAPAKTSRVALLLDSNQQTARSYPAQGLLPDNRQSSQKKSHAFSDPVTLQIDDSEFLIGNVEPVSQLRYVAANNRVYLQADHIAPLLQSPQTMFTELQITGTVNSVVLELKKNGEHPAFNTTAYKPATNAQDWSELRAIAVIDATQLDKTSIAAVSLEPQAGDNKLLIHVYPYNGHTALRPHDAKFAFLLSDEQARKLGICVYC